MEKVPQMKWFHIIIAKSLDMSAITYQKNWQIKIGIPERKMKVCIIIKTKSTKKNFRIGLISNFNVQ
jgi:hypothetical protein